MHSFSSRHSNNWYNFNHLFKQAITFAKKAHNETDIADNAVSVSYAKS